MARYDYRCRTCGEWFEVQRPMAAAVTATPCPSGHLDTVRILSTFATVGATSAGAPGSGCCGGHCGCTH